MVEIEKGSGCSLKTGKAVSNFWIVGPEILENAAVLLEEIVAPKRTWKGTVKKVVGNKAHIQVRYQENADDRDGGDLADVSVTIGNVEFPNDKVVVDPPDP